MNSYIIPYHQEVFYKLLVSANSLEEALTLFEEGGSTCGVVSFSDRVGEENLDEEGVRFYNANKYPDEIAQYSGLTLAEVEENYYSGI